jgi:cardiolipin synthase A/B
MPMSALTFRRALALGLVLIANGLPGLSCSSLPSFVPAIEHRPARPVPLEGAARPLSAEQSRAILQRLQRGGEPTDIFSRHLALEEAIVGSPLTTGNALRLLQDGPATYRAMLAPSPRHATTSRRCRRWEPRWCASSAVRLKRNAA